MASVDFACKTFSLETILRCSFGISDTEYQVFKLLANRRREMSLAEIGQHIPKDRSTLQRAANGLHKKGLAKRFQKNLENGGYVFSYQSMPKELVKERVRKMFCNFESLVNAEIERW